MDLIVELTREHGMSTILITHDLGLAAAYCDRVVVMEKGHVVETAPSRQDFQGAGASLYAQADARDAAPRRDSARSAARGHAPSPPPAPVKPVEAEGTPLLVVSNLVKEYPRQGATGTLANLFRRKNELPKAETFKAVDGISFAIRTRRERRPGRRIRLRQVDDLDDGDAPARPDRRPHHLRRRGYRRDPGQGIRHAAAAQAHPDGVPGSDRQPQSALHRGARHRRSDLPARRHQGRRGRARALRGTGAPGRPAASSCSTAFRTSFPAGRRRASASRARSRCSRIWSSSTSRPPRSTCRCRRWCSTCCRTSRSRSA